MSALLAICFAVGALAAACKDESQTSTCAQCETIGTTEVCMQCKTNGYAPIDGICTNVGDELTAAGCQDSSGQSPTTTAKCAKCTKANYFLFQGGCYKVGKEPGSLVCTDALGSNTDKPGVCKACAEGYFTNTQATETQESCVACGDENCATCAAGTDTNKCSACAEGYFVGASGNEGPCISCSSTSAGSGDWTGVAGCAKCTKPTSAGAATCTECQTDKYLKTETSGTSCVASDKCTGGFFPMTDTADSNKKKCLACSDGTNGVANCAECTAPVQGKAKPTCTKCTSGFLHTPEGGETSCPDNCPDGYFGHTATSGDLKTCQSCATEATLNPAVTGIPRCTQCAYTAANTNTLKCTACGSGYKLEGETCVSTGGVNLSTGAIAGISVAVIAVVVGGLVEFLCWCLVAAGSNAQCDIAA